MKQKYLAKVESYIAGIPCLVGVTTFFIKAPDYDTWDSDLDYYGYEEIEFDILDRKGYIAPWLERKMTEDDKERIIRDIKEAYNEDSY
jgi:hypothetical protein